MQAARQPYWDTSHAVCSLVHAELSCKHEAEYRCYCLCLCPLLQQQHWCTFCWCYSTQLLEPHKGVKHITVAKEMLPFAGYLGALSHVWCCSYMAFAGQNVLTQ